MISQQRDTRNEEDHRRKKRRIGKKATTGEISSGNTRQPFPCSFSYDPENYRRDTFTPGALRYIEKVGDVIQTTSNDTGH